MSRNIETSRIIQPNLKTTNITAFRELHADEYNLRHLDIKEMPALNGAATTEEYAMLKYSVMPCDNVRIVNNKLVTVTCKSKEEVQKYFNENPITFSWLDHKISRNFSRSDNFRSVFPEYESIQQHINVNAQKEVILGFRENELRLKYQANPIEVKKFGSLVHKGMDSKGMVAESGQPYLSFVLTLDNSWTNYTVNTPLPKKVKWINIFANVGGLWTTVFTVCSIGLRYYTVSHMVRNMFDRLFLTKRKAALGSSNDPSTGTIASELAAYENLK